MSTNEQKKMDVKQTLFGCMKRLDGIKMTIADVIEFLDSERGLTLRAPDPAAQDAIIQDIISEMEEYVHLDSGERDIFDRILHERHERTHAL